jgi:adenosylcobinamide-phosphate synthase
MSDISQIATINFISIIVAFVLDIVFGEPPVKYHPVVYIGQLISFVETKLYNSKNKKQAGLLLVIVLLIIVIIVSLLCAFIFYKIHIFLFFLFSTYIIFCCISMKSLNDHSMEVFYPLKEGKLLTARENLSKMVSRDTKDMGRDKIITSTVESIAENFVDGFLSPVLYIAIGGFLCGLIYKTINTMDSMIGYKNERYKDFGFFAAKLDDLINLIPARLSIFIIAIASFVTDKSVRDVFKTCFAFRRKYPSPNGGYPISAFSGALNIQLCGPTYYSGKLVDKPHIGYSGLKHLVEDIILEANNLLVASSFIVFYFLLILYTLLL